MGNLIGNPLIIAVYSALIGVSLSQLGNYLYGSWNHKRKRDSVFGVLLNQLQNHRKQLNGLGDRLGKGWIEVAPDSSAVLHFLNGDVVALPKDQKLVTALYNHLGNLETIRRSLEIIGMRSSGFTSAQSEGRDTLEQNLKKAIPSMLADLGSCLEELPGKGGVSVAEPE